MLLLFYIILGACFSSGVRNERMGDRTCCYYNIMDLQYFLYGLADAKCECHEAMYLLLRRHLGGGREYTFAQP